MATSAVDGGGNNSVGGEDIKFSVMVSLFQWIQKSKSSAKKRSKFRKFIDTFCRKPQDNFAAIRLILPGLDRERGSYGLKEHVLATCLIDALAMSRESDDARRLLNWRKGGPKTGSNAGNFSLVAAEVLQRRQGMASAGLTIKELNDFLDHLASSENRAEKTSILSDLIRKTNAQEMKWIIMIILKDLKLGISEKSIFHEFHPDAEDLFNVTCDLKLVCEKLRDRSQRHKRQDIEVGKPVRPQLALRVSNASAAWKKLYGKEVVVECKFDGDRIQIHKNNSELNFFSRNFLDHQEYAHGMSDVITQNILADKCILDGEMLVWDASINRFAEFGSNQEIAKAAREGLDSDRQLCYVAFDILYVGDTSVIHRSLKERQEILQKVVKPIKGRLEILVPNGGLNAHRLSGEPCWSIIARSVDDVDKFFKGTVENRDEGIVLKDLTSKWEPSDRSGKWLKLKPDYVRPGSDLDVLIIGGYYGSGRHGGEVAQFLVGLAEPPAPNTYPRRFISFCRVGTGISDEERNIIVTRLKPYFRKYEYPKQAPPTFYQVTNNTKERPDVWVESPEKSIIVSITSDIRTIRTEVFAAPYSLRFPRIDKVRYDKPWHECLDVQSFVDLVHSTNGTTQREDNYGIEQDHESKTIRSSRKREKKNVSAVPSHFVQTDVSRIKGETSMFSDMVFYFANVPSSHTLESLHKMVVEHGGSFSMNLNKSVTHCIAAESRGIKFQAAKLHGDVIQCSWLFVCCLQKKLLPLQPKYFLFLSDSTKKKMEAEVDEYSDSFYSDISIEEIKLLLRNIEHLEDSKTVEYYKKKYCPKDKWARFHGCCIYFFIPKQCLEYSDCKVLVELAMRRMKVEISVGGGKVCDNLFHATHVVVMSLPEFDVKFNEVLNSFSEAEKHVLYNTKLHVVGARWLEDSFKEDQKLVEESYSLKPSNFQMSISEKRHDKLKGDSGKCNRPSSPDKHGGQIKAEGISDQGRAITLPKRGRKRDRGRPTGSATAKGKVGINIPRRVKRKVTSSRAKIHENESDESATSGEHLRNDESEAAVGSHESIAIRISGIQNEDDVQDLELSPDGKAFPPGTAECSVIGERLDEAYETSYGSGNIARGKDKVDELEDPVDPVQAMLLHMIPHLDSKPTRSVDTLVKDDKPEADTNPSPKKKKKVSYKDVAGELLKDW
ncbi:DNA ligase 4 isoform X2 [Solanum tuberosum]|uniref:DNA ligase 4 isoform X2 n=1 Tax=Solanum tuberosum TaxID=4113 RepID=UPI0003D277CD|nr:PREDICTED: DNA ligase 4 isoform X2 [Solanum tuberosum]